MEAFINKMRRLKGVRKQLIVEEAWKALSSANMAEYLRYMYKLSLIHICSGTPPDQVWDFSLLCFSFSLSYYFGSVSYTHLDVYKRQTLYSKLEEYGLKYKFKQS